MKSRIAMRLDFRHNSQRQQKKKENRESTAVCYIAVKSVRTNLFPVHVSTVWLSSTTIPQTFLCKSDDESFNMFLNFFSITSSAEENTILNADSLSSSRLISSKDTHLIPSNPASAIWSSIMLVSGQITSMQSIHFLYALCRHHVRLKNQTFAVSSRQNGKYFVSVRQKIFDSRILLLLQLKTQPRNRLELL